MTREEEADRLASEIGCNTHDERAKYKAEVIEQVFEDQGIKDPPPTKVDKKKSK